MLFKTLTVWFQDKGAGPQTRKTARVPKFVMN